MSEAICKLGKGLQLLVLAVTLAIQKAKCFIPAGIEERPKTDVQVWPLLIHANDDKCIDCVSYVLLMGGRAQDAFQAKHEKKGEHF